MLHVYYADLDATTSLRLGNVYKLHYHVIHGSKYPSMQFDAPLNIEVNTDIASII